MQEGVRNVKPFFAALSGIAGFRSADIDALNDGEIARLKKDHEELRSLIKVYCLDIPHNVCKKLKEFDEEYTDKLLGYKYLFEKYAAFEDGSEGKGYLTKQVLSAFSDTMDSIFRESFGTSDKTAEKSMKTIKGLMGFLFGKGEKED